MWLVLVLTNAFIDRKVYNNGRCKCGVAWKYFSTYSHGADGYYCEKCGEVIWVKVHPNNCCSKGERVSDEE
jgi:hypothetical protein